MIGRLHHVIFDCADPHAAARFWAQVLGRGITYDSPDFVVVAENDTTSGLAFQRAAGSLAPTWPAAGVPQQVHPDVMVDDLERATEQVLALGARRLADTVFADPAGHPFCLILRPGWAAPIG